MSTIFRAYKFELRPTESQKVLLEKHFGCSRFVYNYFLNRRIEQYKETKKSDNFRKQSLELTKLKKELVWLNEVSRTSLTTSLRNLDRAFSNFFQKKSKFPKFKSKRRNNSFTVYTGTKIKENKLHVFKFKEGIKINLHRMVPGKIRSCTISKTPAGRYFASILIKEEYNPIEKTGKSCGIDLGLNHFVVTSDGTKFDNPKHYKKYERKLVKLSRGLSRRKKGSSSYENQRRKFAKIHEKISNSRKDTLHKVSHSLIKNYDIIAVESLNIKNMVKNRALAKHINDASWGTLLRFLEYKALWNKKEVVKVDQFYPSSKTCSECGWIKEDLELSDREWQCPSCGAIHDRDINAANNILKEGLRILFSAGTAEYTGGDQNKTSDMEHKSVKPEVLTNNNIAGT